jgi:hypothetical protein
VYICTAVLLCAVVRASVGLRMRVYLGLVRRIDRKRCKCVCVHVDSYYVSVLGCSSVLCASEGMGVSCDSWLEMLL